MALAVYLLCAATSLVCFALLFRQHRRAPSPLAFKSSLAFLCFALANILLFFDLVVFTQVDLRIWRSVVTLIGVCVLLVGLTQDHEGGRRG
jgi:hypothetical protein